MRLNVGPRWPLTRILVAIAIWAIQFGVAYGVVALACPRGLGALIPWVVGAATVVAVVAALALAVPAVRGARPFGAAQWVAAVASLLSVAAVLWQASALLWSRLCP
jgi:hypothetical protein